MKFIQETGAVVSTDGDVITIIDGTPGMVVFPAMLIQELHTLNPGSVKLLAHTHPPGMKELSSTDISTLKGQALGLYPYPIRMSTITSLPKRFSGDNPLFVECRYLAYWEDKESWKSHGGVRKFTLIKELERECKLADHIPSYQKILIEKSYVRE